MPTPAIKGLRSYFIVRVSGIPVEEVEAFRAPRLKTLVQELKRLDTDVERNREVAGQVLFDAIGTTSDRRLRNRLVQLRRDLFNSRQPGAADLSAAENVLAPRAYSTILSLLNVRADRQQLLDSVSNTYQKDLERARRRLQASVNNEDFRRGLIVSSPTLALNLRRYRETSPSAFTARSEQIERGILRYFTRMAMKSTPFGTLCGIAPGRLIPSGDPSSESGSATQRAVQYHGDPRTKQSVVRLNKSLFGVLWAHLKRRPGVRAHLAVGLTPTLTADEETFRYLASGGGREVFQRVLRNEALDRVVELLQSQPTTKLSDLIEVLARDEAIEASREEAQKYLDHLLAIGLLRFRSGVSEQDADWDVPLANALRRIDDDHAATIAELLGHLRAALADYAAASSDDRAALAALLRERVGETLGSLGIAGRVRSDLLFYEDAAAKGELTITLTNPMSAAITRLGEFVEALLPLSVVRNEQATMRHYFDTQHAASCAVPLLQFYEEYYRDHFKGHLERARAASTPGGRKSIGDYNVGNPFKIPIIDRRFESARRLLDLLREKWRANESIEEIVITQSDLRQATDSVDALPPRERSVALFCQLDASVSGEGAGHDARVVFSYPTVHVGRGKYFSRFLYLLPTSMSQSVYADNNATETERRAEISADGDFNANLHPPLLRWEISYPTSENGSSHGQLLCSDLDVARDPQDPHALQLVHRSSGIPVVPFDLGFLNPNMRPPLFQLLSRFTQAGSVAFAIPEAVHFSEHAGVMPQPLNHVLHRPRISYERQVVLARRRWSVPSSVFPSPQPAESECEYFIRLNRWREEAGIPEQCYFRVLPMPRPPSALDHAPRAPAVHTGGQPDVGAMDSDLGPQAAQSRPATAQKNSPEGVDLSPQPTRRSRDWHKPQFMDFDSPLLVKLLAHIPGALAEFVFHFEERLPNGRGLAEAGGEHYATELVLQFDFPAQLPAQDE